MFNTKTKTLATADLDNALYQLNDMDEGTSSRELSKSIESNINFAERIELLNAHEAQVYRDRLNKIRNDRDRRQREERIAKARSSENDTSKDFVRNNNQQRVSTQQVEHISTNPNISNSNRESSDISHERRR